MRPALALLAAATATLLAGCGIDVSQSDDRDPRPERVRAGLVALYAGPSAPPAVLEEGGCFADALLSRLSLDRLVTAGVVGDDGEVVTATPMLDVDVAGAWVDALDDCTTYAAVAARAAGSPPGFVACLDAAVPVTRQREALVATLTGRTGSDPAAVELLDAQSACAGGSG